MNSERTFYRWPLVCALVLAMAPLWAQSETIGAKVNPQLNLASEAIRGIPMQVRATSDFPDLTEGYAVYQSGSRVQKLSKPSFDPTQPFCYLDLANNQSAKTVPVPVVSGKVIPIKVQPTIIHAGKFGSHAIYSDAVSILMEEDTAELELSCHWPKPKTSARSVVAGTMSIEDVSRIVGNLFQFEHSQVRQTKNRGADVRFESETNLVYMEAAVVDVSSNNFISSLQLSDFHLTEGCDQNNKTSCDPIKVHKFGLSRMSDGNVHFIMAPDLSGSTTGDRPLIEAAMTRFVTRSKASDSFTLIPFDSGASVFMQRTHDRNRARLEISRMMKSFGGGTNITAAVNSAAQEATQTGRGARNVLVLITDGEDGYDYKALSAKAILANLVIFAIDVRGSMADPLRGLAESTGGFYLRADGYANLGVELDRLMSIWGSYYFFEYYGKPPTANGRIPHREIHVRWKSPVHVYASRGFTGPQVQGVGSQKAAIEESELNARIEAEYRKRKAEYEALDIFSKSDRATSLDQVESLLSVARSAGELDIVVQRGIDLLTDFSQFEQIIRSDSVKNRPGAYERFIELMVTSLPKTGYLKLTRAQLLALAGRCTTTEQIDRVARHLMPMASSAQDVLEFIQLSPKAAAGQEILERLAEMRSQLAVDSARTFGSFGPTESQLKEFSALATSAEAQFAIDRAIMKSVLSGNRSALMKIKAAAKTAKDVSETILKLFKISESPKDILAALELFPNETVAAGSVTRGPLILGNIEQFKNLRFGVNDAKQLLVYLPRLADKIKILATFGADLSVYLELLGDRPTADTFVVVMDHVLPRAKTRTEFVSLLVVPRTSDVEVLRAHQTILGATLGIFKKLPGSISDYQRLLELCSSDVCRGRVNVAAQNDRQMIESSQKSNPETRR